MTAGVNYLSKNLESSFNENASINQDQNRNVSATDSRVNGLGTETLGEVEKKVGAGAKRNPPKKKKKEMLHQQEMIQLPT